MSASVIMPAGAWDFKVGTCHREDNWLYSTNCLPVVIKPFNPNGSFKLCFCVGGEAALVDHNYPGEGGGAERAQETGTVAKSCQAFWEWWLAQGRVCRWKNQRVTWRGRGSSPLSLELSILYVYFVCLLATDRHSQSVHCGQQPWPWGDRVEGRPLCLECLFSTSEDQGSYRPQRGGRMVDRDSLRVSALPGGKSSFVIS